MFRIHLKTVAARQRLITGAGIAGGVNIIIAFLLTPKMRHAAGEPLTNMIVLYVWFFVIFYFVTRQFACTVMTSTRSERIAMVFFSLQPIVWAADTLAPFNYWFAASCFLSVLFVGISRGGRAKAIACCDQALKGPDEPPAA